MEYPFKDLLPREEATARQGYYRDWTHIDADTFHQISELVKFIREKGYGADTRESIAQALERVYHDATMTGNANMEVSMARKHFGDLASRLDASDDKLAQAHREATRKRQLEDLDEKVLSAIEGGEGTSFNLLSIPQDGSVTPDKTTFAKKGKNIFDGNFVKGISVTGGRPNGIISENPDAYVAITEVQPNTQYTVFKSESNVFRIYCSNKYPEVGDNVENLHLGDRDNIANITSLHDTKYFITYVSNGGLPPERFQVALGHNNLEYEEPNRVAFDLAEKSVDTRAINEKNGVLDGYPDGFNISLKGRTITTSDRARVTVGKDRFVLKEGVYPIDGGDYASRRIFLNLQTMDITTPPTVTSGGREYDHLVNLGTLNYKEGYSYIHGVHQIEGKTVKSYTDKIFIADKVNGNYQADVPTLEVQAQESSDIYKLYKIYDDLMEEFPGYVSRELLANDSSGLPIYKYDFKPMNLRSGEKPPVKIIATCTHAHERHATYGLAYFFDDLARNWREKDVLRMLRWNVHFIVVPNQNPWGFSNRKRPNSNDVDLNRNYPAGWERNDNPEEFYGTHGPEPLSEINTQVMAQLLENNMDTDFVLDSHNYLGDPYQGDSVLYIATDDTGVSLDIGRQHVANMVAISKKDGYVPMNANVGLVLERNSFGGSFAKYVNSLGLTGILLENMNTLNHTANTGDPNNGILRFNIESAGNAILTAFNYFTR
ncbi:MAG TPA: DUF2817 domain-containing protein [Candidatus Jeotgalibaca merdavium]|uniref:DUF2817 domain-containing protein n=1 Tax=Candidatus Jeotgalibaca merdavium TaxID=2838627 RepID=A0A9D2KXK8_9LACT|nr:DUF2817 domain-containing protein [Candidatus Jeotgalibaca merdavium]